MNPTTLDAPVEGWNAFDSMDNMSPTSAVILNNFIPGAGSVDTRRGYTLYETLPGVTGRVETLASYNPLGDSKLLAAADGGIWELEDSAIVSIPQASSVNEIHPIGTFQSDKWQTENFQRLTEVGVMVWCNGVDPTQIYNGTTMIPVDITGTDPLLIPTVNDADFIGCLTFKGRMYYWKDDDNAFYYTQPGSYQGEFRKFDMGSFVQQGGRIVTAFSWTQQDSGDGRDDFIVFVFDTGEVLVYQGDDPDTTGYWEQVGRYVTAEPLSIRGVVNYGADAIIMTRDGYVSMASIMQQGRTSDVPAFSRLIHRAVTARTRVAGDLYGWDVELFQRDGLMVFNVPLSDQSFEQHVMNTVTQKWCRFKGYNVNCLEVHNERLFGGANNGEVHALLEGTSDNGRPITFDCLYAFNYFNNPSIQKHVTAAQVLTTHSNPVEIELSAWSDFRIPELNPVDIPEGLSAAIWSIDPASPPSIVGSFWDEEYWSNEGNPSTTKGWQNVSALGFAVALLVRFAKVNESVIWRSTNVRYHEIGAQ
jgi:hypothetical protein